MFLLDVLHYKRWHHSGTSAAPTLWVDSSEGASLQFYLPWQELLPYLHLVLTMACLHRQKPRQTQDTDKLTQNLMGICLCVCLCAVWTPPYNSVQPTFYRSLYWSQCENTITQVTLWLIYTGGDGLGFWSRSYSWQLGLESESDSMQCENFCIVQCSHWVPIRQCK